MTYTSQEISITYKKELDRFAARWQLSESQRQQFVQYLALLLDHAARFNITTIISIPDMLDYHFSDSLELTRHVSLAHKVCVDVGSGGGFPGIPLKILVPESRWILIEVNQKKIQFLQTVIDELGLADIELYDADWRSFLRTTTYDVRYVCARASLQPAELVRVLRSGCAYHESTVVYWAATSWQPQAPELPLIAQKIEYTVGIKKRWLVFFKSSSHS